MNHDRAKPARVFAGVQLARAPENTAWSTSAPPISVSSPAPPVVSVVAVEQVDATAAIEHIGTVVAHNLVGEFIAGQIDGDSPCAVGGPQLLGMRARAERVIHSRENPVRTLANAFDNPVVGAVHEIGVVAVVAVRLVGKSRKGLRLVMVPSYPTVQARSSRFALTKPPLPVRDLPKG